MSSIVINKIAQILFIVSILFFYSCGQPYNSSSINLQRNITDDSASVPQFDTPAKLLGTFNLDFPADLLGELEGKVRVKIFINVNGKISDVKIVKGIPSIGINEAVLKTLHQVQFEPAKSNGKPIGSHFLFTIIFKYESGRFYRWVLTPSPPDAESVKRDFMNMELRDGK